MGGIELDPIAISKIGNKGWLDGNDGIYFSKLVDGPNGIDRINTMALLF